MELTNRLKAVADYITKCDTIADIGTDHAYIPIYCVQNKICKYALACDVNEGPLKIAKKNIASKGMSDKIETRLSDGLKKIYKNEVNTIVIAGMGGQLINEIISAGLNIITPDTELILQPMIAVSDTRKYLLENGFSILGEKIAVEGEKLYNILKVKRKEQNFDDFDIFIGRQILNDENAVRYFERNIRISKNIIEGLEKSTNKEKEISHEKYKLSLYEKALNKVLQGEK